MEDFSKLLIVVTLILGLLIICFFCADWFFKRCEIRRLDNKSKNALKIIEARLEVYRDISNHLQAVKNNVQQLRSMWQNRQNLNRNENRLHMFSVINERIEVLHETYIEFCRKFDRFVENEKKIELKLSKLISHIRSCEQMIDVEKMFSDLDLVDQTADAERQLDKLIKEWIDMELQWKLHRHFAVLSPFFPACDGA